MGLGSRRGACGASRYFVAAAVAPRSFLAAAAMCSASIPAAARSSSGLAEPRPLRALDGTRLDAALRPPALERGQGGQSRLRDPRRADGAARRPEALPPARLEMSGTSRVPVDLRDRDDDRPARSRGRNLRRDGDRRPLAGRVLQPAGARALRLRRVRPRRRRRHDGGDLQRGRLTGGAPQALEPLLDLRQQQDHDRGQHGARLLRGRRHALHRLRLERHPGR